ncbi:MAG: RNA polymerase sigma factor [Defluviitaleaceae bacterium]|nr:RNA polymerase sigma factor [Defluviitaleaceae bacterium]MCL2835880.1 RNA polymerase sigma factor [Defluviitaleaceae bacterium]
MSQRQDEKLLKQLGELLEKAASGDIAAFELLIAEYEKLIFSQAFRMMGNAWDARDAAQESLIKIYKNIHKCHDIHSFKSWIRAITNNTCIDELRRRGNKREDSLNRMFETEEGEVELQFESTDPGPEAVLLGIEKQERIQLAINRLPVKYKTLIVLRDINGLSYEELAETTGLSLGTVKSRLSRSREKLKKLLAGEY